MEIVTEEKVQKKRPKRGVVSDQGGLALIRGPSVAQTGNAQLRFVLVVCIEWCVGFRKSVASFQHTFKMSDSSSGNVVTEL